MRTTVELDDELLQQARERAARGRSTLSRLVTEALRAFLALPDRQQADPPFELMTHGKPGGRFPSPEEVADALEAEDQNLVSPTTGDDAPC